MADLRVELYGQLVGHLVGTDWRTFDFRTAREAVERFSLGSTILSEAIPLELVPTRARAERRRTFFAELLPEGRALTRLAAAADARLNRGRRAPGCSPSRFDPHPSGRAVMTSILTSW